MRQSFRFFMVFLASMAFAFASVDASAYTLQIFGNANMDDKIDEADATYIADVIASSMSPTTLSDANGDGKVDGRDIDQVQRIINRTVEQLIVMDEANRTVRIDMPVKSVVPLVDRDAKILGVLGATGLAYIGSAEGHEFPIL